jgi:hypothetical protein
LCSYDFAEVTIAYGDISSNSVLPDSLTQIEIAPLAIIGLKSKNFSGIKSLFFLIQIARDSVKNQAPLGC